MYSEILSSTNIYKQFETDSSILITQLLIKIQQCHEKTVILCYRNSCYNNKYSMCTNHLFTPTGRR